MADSSNNLLRFSRAGAVQLIEIDRPSKRNALNDEAISGLANGIREIADDVKCVVVASTGEHFSAGLDLNELRERNAFEGAQHSEFWHRCLASIENSRAPVVAALSGAVIGGGLELAASCHIRVADTTTYYALPEAARGIFVGGGGSVRLPRIFGVQTMMDMMLTGRVLTAQDGYEKGLSHYLCEAGESTGKAMQIAERISQNTDMTNYAVTQVLPKIARSEPEAGYVLESLIAGIAQSDPEAKSRLTSFIEGREAKVRPSAAEDE